MNLYSSKKQFFFFFTLLLLISCSSEKEVPIPENAVFDAQTELISLTSNNNQLKLTWKPVVINKFKKYKIYRLDSHTDKYMSPEVIVYSGKLISEGSDNLKNEYIDNDVPFNSFIGYAVVTEFINKENKVENVISLNHLSYENEKISFSITSIEKLDDGTVKLIWEEDANAGFENYTIYALNDRYLNREEDLNNENILKVNVNQKDNIVIDATSYKKEQVFYAVSKVINGKRIRSKNYVSIQNPRSLKFRPGQTLRNPYNENEIIIINNEEGEVLFFNINSLSSTKVTTNGEIFFCSIGQFKGVDDLYIPTKKGNVFVIDLTNHNIKEIINLNKDIDYNILSAIPIDNHILFLEKHSYADIGGMFVYDRINNKVLNRNGSFSISSKSKLIYAKENYFLSLWRDGLEYGSGSTLGKININGDEVSQDLNSQGTAADSHLFAFSDDKTFFVSSKYGYQSDVNYQNFTQNTTQKYSQNGSFGDAKITTNNRIYFSVPNYSRIDVFEKNNFNSPIRQYTTTGIPLLIEVFKNRIISLNQLETSFLLETIPE